MCRGHRTPATAQEVTALSVIRNQHSRGCKQNDLLGTHSGQPPLLIANLSTGRAASPPQGMSPSV